MSKRTKAKQGFSDVKLRFSNLGLMVLPFNLELSLVLLKEQIHRRNLLIIGVFPGFVNLGWTLMFIFIKAIDFKDV